MFVILNIMKFSETETYQNIEGKVSFSILFQFFYHKIYFQKNFYFFLKFFTTKNTEKSSKNFKVLIPQIFLNHL